VLKVWGRRSSFNVRKVMWLIGELGLVHEHVDAGGQFGGLDAADFLAMNPYGESGIRKVGKAKRAHHLHHGARPAYCG
jgi:glutathione S-transferase